MATQIANTNRLCGHPTVTHHQTKHPSTGDHLTIRQVSSMR